MGPVTPSSTPSNANVNEPFGGNSQATGAYNSAATIAAALPQQLLSTAQNADNINANPTSILPSISINAPTYSAPTAPTISASSYLSNPLGYNQQVQNAETGLGTSENQILSSAEGNLSTAEQQYGNLTPVEQSLQSQFNIPGYQNDITTLNGLLNSLSSDVNVQTNQGIGATSTAARNEAYEQQYQPLSNYLGEATSALSYGQQDVNSLLNTYEQSLSNELQPLETNIQTLPGMFGQTNSLAEAGYNQGAETIQNTISNQISQEQANAYTTMANVSVQQLKDEYGDGAAAVAGNLATDPNGLNAGVSFKNGSNGSGGYDFTVNGKPASMAQWAISNASSLYGSTTDEAQSIISTLTGLAGGGDTYSAQALAAINATAANNNGVPQITPAIINQYPALFGGLTTTSSKPAASSNIGENPQTFVNQMAPYSNGTQNVGTFQNDLTTALGLP